jgi:hypothetical protein
MITRISEIINEWTGWCPNGHTINTRKSGDADFRHGANNPQVKSPGPSGTDGSDMPWGGKYEHTQRGTLLIGAGSAAIILILAATYLFGIAWVAIIVLGMMVFLLAIMSTLTASVGDDTLTIRFGPVGLIRKSWQISEIVSATTVTNQWIYGWGIRWTPHGLLYNVSGSHAVEILLYSGKKVRIGTDEPEALKTAIEKARIEIKNPSRGMGYP